MAKALVAELKKAQSIIEAANRIIERANGEELPDEPEDESYNDWDMIGSNLTDAEVEMRAVADGIDTTLECLNAIAEVELTEVKTAAEDISAEPEQQAPPPGSML